MAKQNHTRSFRVYTETGNGIPLDRFSNVFRTAIYAPDPEGVYSHAVACEISGYTLTNGETGIDIVWPGHPERTQRFATSQPKR